MDNNNENLKYTLQVPQFINTVKPKNVQLHQFPHCKPTVLRCRSVNCSSSVKCWLRRLCPKTEVSCSVVCQGSHSPRSSSVLSRPSCKKKKYSITSTGLICIQVCMLSHVHIISVLSTESGVCYSISWI